MLPQPSSVTGNIGYGTVSRAVHPTLRVEVVSVPFILLFGRGYAAKTRSIQASARIRVTSISPTCTRVRIVTKPDTHSQVRPLGATARERSLSLTKQACRPAGPNPCQMPSGPRAAPPASAVFTHSRPHTLNNIAAFYLLPAAF
jgi:hypothetical protein